MLGGQSLERTKRLRDGRIVGGRFSGQTGKSLAVLLDVRAQLLDFAFRLENPARFAADSTGHQMGTAKDVALGRRDRQRGEPACLRRVLVGVRNPRVADRMTDRTG